MSENNDMGASADADRATRASTEPCGLGHSAGIPSACPFCGSRDVRADSQYLREERVFCGDCHAQGPCLEDRAEAIAAWNKRAVPDRAAAALAEARDHLASEAEFFWGKPGKKAAARAEVAVALARRLDDALAQAIETRRAETGTGSVHESAVGNADAPNSQEGD